MKYPLITPDRIDKVGCLTTKFGYVLTHIKQRGVSMEADYPFVARKEDRKSTSYI